MPTSATDSSASPRRANAGPEITGDTAVTRGSWAVEDVDAARVDSWDAARAVLARGCRIDLHPRAFGPGRAASTTIAQIGCLIHQTDDAPAFDLTVFATLAEPFFHWLVEAGAGPGLVIA